MVSRLPTTNKNWFSITTSKTLFAIVCQRLPDCFCSSRLITLIRERAQSFFRLSNLRLQSFSIKENEVQPLLIIMAIFSGGGQISIVQSFQRPHRYQISLLKHAVCLGKEHRVSFNFTPTFAVVHTKASRFYPE